MYHTSLCCVKPQKSQQSITLYILDCFLSPLIRQWRCFSSSTMFPHFFSISWLIFLHSQWLQGFQWKSSMYNILVHVVRYLSNDKSVVCLFYWWKERTFQDISHLVATKKIASGCRHLDLTLRSFISVMQPWYSFWAFYILNYNCLKSKNKKPFTINLPFWKVINIRQMMDK